MFARSSIIRNQSPAGSNLLLTVLILLLTVLGLMVLLSASAMISLKLFDNPYYYFLRQSIYAAIGIVFFLFATQIPYSFWHKAAWPLYFFSLILLLLVFVPPFARTAGGASRWISLAGISVQPSDIARFATMLLLARLYADKDEISYALVATTFAVLGLTVLLIFKEPDFGTAAHLGLTALVFLFFTKFPVRVILGFSTLFFSFALYAVIYEPFRLDRIKAWLNPARYRYEEGYQILASYRSFLLGGWKGSGLGESLERHRLVARHTDFIFARVAEDMGMLGVTFILTIYFFIAVYGFLLLMKIEDSFGRLLGTGLLLLFILQAIFNIAVTMNVVPTTGINLPLFSSGGSSLVMFLFMLGIILNVLRYRTR